MKLKRFFAVIFALIGIAVAAATVTVSLGNLDAEPNLLTPPLEARGRAVAMLDAVCAEDFAGASEYLLGKPGLGVDREPADPVGALIWKAFTNSLSYELEGACFATDDGLAQKVVLTCLDIDSVTAQLRERSRALLEERVTEAEDTAEIYDENNEYREEFVMAVLFDAAEQAIREDAREMTVELTLKLSYQDGQWWVIADNALLNAISGGILY